MEPQKDKYTLSFFEKLYQYARNKNEADDEQSTDEEDEEIKGEEKRFHDEYFQVHYKVMIIAYILLFGINGSLAIRIIVQENDWKTILNLIIANEVLVIIILFCIYSSKQTGIKNKLSCAINIIQALIITYLEQTLSGGIILGDYYELRGLLIYGFHSNLMFSSNILYDLIGFITAFIIHTLVLSHSDRSLELVLLWGLVIFSLLQRYRGHSAAKDRFFSRERQKQWLDVIQNVLPSAVVSLNKSYLKYQPSQSHQNGSITKHPQALGINFLEASNRSNFYHHQQQQQQQQQNSISNQTPLTQKQQQFEMSQNGVNQSRNPFQQLFKSSSNPVHQSSSHPNSSSTSSPFISSRFPYFNQKSVIGFQDRLQGSITFPVENNNQEDELLGNWKINLANEQSKKIYKISDTLSFIQFTKRVLIDAKQLVIDSTTSYPVPQNQNVVSKQTNINEGMTIRNQQMSEIIQQTNSVAMQTKLKENDQILSSQNAQNIMTLNQNINSITNFNSKPINSVCNSKANNVINSIQPLTYSHINVQNSEISQHHPKKSCIHRVIDFMLSVIFKKQISQRIAKENKIDPISNNQSGYAACSLEIGGQNRQITLFQQLKNLLEEFNKAPQVKQKNFFIWKFNGKYYEDGISDHNEQEKLIKNANQQQGVSVQIRVCGFMGKQSRLVLCMDDISVTEQIQLYQTQDKFKDLILANTAHDLRQPLNTLNYTVSEAKKILEQLRQMQNTICEQICEDSGGQNSEGSKEVSKFNSEKQDDNASLQDHSIPLIGKIEQQSFKTANFSVFLDQALEPSSYSVSKSELPRSNTTTDIDMIVELLELAEISGSSLKYLINDILDHAKLREGKLQANFKECSLSSIFEFTKKIFGYQFKERKIRYRILQDTEVQQMLKICTDQQRLQQVLMNLLSNAIKFTEANKYIVLHISRVFKIVNNRSVSLLKISVLDQGCGMTQKQLDEIFKPYVSFNNNNMNIEGIGLGLHISKSIAGLLGPYPKLFVKSKINEGTKFFFYIYHQLRRGSQGIKIPYIKAIKVKLPRVINNLFDSFIHSQSYQNIHQEIEKNKQTGEEGGEEEDKSPASEEKKYKDASVIINQPENQVNEEFNEIRLKEVLDSKVSSILEEDNSGQQDLKFDLSDAHRQNRIPSFPELCKVNNLDQDLRKIRNTISPQDEDHFRGPDQQIEEEDENNTQLDMSSILIQIKDMEDSEREIGEQQNKAGNQLHEIQQKYSSVGQIYNSISTLNKAKIHKIQPVKSPPLLVSQSNSSNTHNMVSNAQTEATYKVSNSKYDSNEANEHKIEILLSKDQKFHNESRTHSKSQSEQADYQMLVNNFQIRSPLINAQSNTLCDESDHVVANFNSFQNGQLSESNFFAKSPASTPKGNFSQISFTTIFSNQQRFKQQHPSYLSPTNAHSQKSSLSPSKRILHNGFSYVLDEKSSHSKQEDHILNNFNQNKGLQNQGIKNENKINMNNCSDGSSCNVSLYSFGGKNGQSPSSLQQTPSQLKKKQSLFGSKNYKKKKNSIKNHFKTTQNIGGLSRAEDGKIPMMLQQFSKKYPNALNEMEASTGSIGISMQEELQVLVADDEVFGIFIIKMILKKSENFTFEIKDANNGKDSLEEFYKRNSPSSQNPFDLVISDIQMPLMDGIESVKQMKQLIKQKNYHPATFIGISGQDLQQEKDDYGFDLILVKPLVEQQLINAINQFFLNFY